MAEPAKGQPPGEHAFMRKDAWCWCGEPKPVEQEECRACRRIRTIFRQERRNG